MLSICIVKLIWQSEESSQMLDTNMQQQVSAKTIMIGKYRN